MHQMAMVGNNLFQLDVVVIFIALVFSANHETAAVFQRDLGCRRPEEIDSALEVLRFRSPPPSSQKKRSNNHERCDRGDQPGAEHVRSCGSLSWLQAALARAGTYDGNQSQSQKEH